MNLVDEHNPILRAKAADIKFSDPQIDLDYCGQQMLQLMHDRKGIGLAGPQVGLPYRIFVMHDIVKAKKWVVINPNIITFSNETELDIEGCLSFPHLTLRINRAKSIGVEYQNINGDSIQEELSGIWARCFQHETDHLNGICFDTLVSRLALNIARRKQLKRIKLGELD